MNALQKIEEDIKEFLDKELKEGEFFFNECEFQVKLALFLKEKKNYEVFLEYTVPLDAKIIQAKIREWKKSGRVPPFSNNKEKIDIDIVIKKDGLFYPIELKYRTTKIKGLYKRFGVPIDDSQLLKDQGAVPRGRYDFWKDVARLEFIRRCFGKIVGGLCVFLTNDKRYTEEATGTSQDFTMEKEKLHTNLLRFRTDGLIKRNPKFSLLGEYRIKEWYCCSNIGNKGIDFQYCIVKISQNNLSNHYRKKVKTHCRIYNKTT